MNLHIPDIPGYQLGELLGSGGMGCVYKAIQLQGNLQQVVAIKVLNIQHATNEKSNERFLREGQVLATLSHPNIVSVISAGVVENNHYLVMKYLPGGTLESRLQQGIPRADGLTVIKTIARALGYAHQRNIIHRDVKPGNILLYEDGTPALSDFGLAKILEEGQAELMSGIAYTAAYASPEQITGNTPVDRRTDLYALGVLLFQILAGRLPYIGTSLAQGYHHINSPIPSLPPDVRMFQPIINRLIAKNPDHRYSTVEAFLIALAGIECPTETLAIIPKALTPPQTIATDQSAQRVKTVAIITTPGPKRRWLWPTIAVALTAAATVPIILHQQQLQQPVIPKPEPQPIPKIESKPEPQPQPAPKIEPKPEPYLPLNIIRDPLQSGGEGPALVIIPAGDFAMGSPTSEPGRDPNDEKQHTVSIASFAIGMTEVTIAEFRRFVTATSYQTDTEQSKGCYGWTGNRWRQDPQFNWQNNGIEQTDQYPVTCVSWYDARAYTNWLTQQTNHTYRLPTEAEWEYAARADTKTPWFWGDDPNSGCQYANVADQNAPSQFHDGTFMNCSDGHIYTAPIASFTANAFKLHDMLGNVWEWTCSLYDPAYEGAEQRCADATAAADATRAMRGGAWLYGKPDWLRAAFREKDAPDYRGGVLGFRVVRELNSAL